MYNNPWATTYNSSSNQNVWLIISIVAAIIGGLTIYFTFLSPQNEGKFSGFKAKLYEYLKFNILLAEELLKITYLILAIYITLSSFNNIEASFPLFLGILVGGNILLRLCYEFSIVLLKIARNTTEINKKLKNSDEKKK